MAKHALNASVPMLTADFLERDPAEVIVEERVLVNGIAPEFHVRAEISYQFDERLDDIGRDALLRRRDTDAIGGELAGGVEHRTLEAGPADIECEGQRTGCGLRLRCRFQIHASRPPLASSEGDLTGATCAALLCVYCGDCFSQ